MATIKKRGNSYLIRVYYGYDINHKQIEHSMTWKPPKGMTPRQIEKEVNRQAVLFEENIRNGIVFSSIKFADFLEQWKKDYAEKKYKLTTIDTMTHIMKRVKEELGHYKLSKITSRILQEFVKSLSDGNKDYNPLGPKTVRNYIHYVSSVLEYAVKLGLISTNPCHNVSLPAKKKAQYEMYSVEEAQTFIDTLIKEAPIMFQCYFLLAIYGGLRRGELCGLTWDNIDFDKKIITIEKAVYHISKKGNMVDTPKSEMSNRCLKLPAVLFPYFRRLQDFYTNEQKRLGNLWTETNFVFKKEFGTGISPLKPNRWLHKFCESENIKYVVPHSLRHLCASLMIDSGASVKTVQGYMGHSDAGTTLNIYAQAFARSQAIASEAVANNFKLG